MIEIDPARQAAIAEVAKSRLNYRGRLATSTLEQTSNVIRHTATTPRSDPWRYFIFDGATAAKLAEFEGETDKQQEMMEELAKQIPGATACGDGFCFGGEENRPAGWRGSNIIGGKGLGIVCVPEQGHPATKDIAARMEEISKFKYPMKRLAEWLQWTNNTAGQGAGFLKDSSQQGHEKFVIETYGKTKILKINPIQMSFRHTGAEGQTTNITLQVWPEPEGCRPISAIDYRVMRERMGIDVSHKETSINI
ncbi:MAG: hypothetical protein Alpg2KO_12170 [Alphaproteobacteria bacterium]